MSAVPTHSRASACNPAGTKKGAPAETGRAQVKGKINMLNVAPSQTKTKNAYKGNGLFADTLLSEVARIKSLLDSRISASRSLPPDEMMSELLTITPAQAEYILKHHNTGNRPLRERRVETLAKAIEDGRWSITSQGISFARNGLLNNGQHRLNAISRAGRTVKIYAAFGESDEAFHVIDAGLGVRTAADVLAIDQVENSTTVAAGARLVWVIENEVGHRRGATVTPDMILEMLDADKGGYFKQAASQGHQLGAKLKCGVAAPTAALYFILRDSKFVTSNYAGFFEDLMTGANLSATSPILKLRDGLAKKTLGSQYRSGADRTISHVAAIILAWNNIIRGRRSSIVWSGSLPFPKAE